MREMLNQLFTKNEQLAILIGILAMEVRPWFVGWLGDIGESLLLVVTFIPVGALLLTDRARIAHELKDRHNPK